MTAATDPVHRIVIPTPYAVGPVNAYLLDAHPPTLIDAGVNTDGARGALIEGLNAHDLAPEDIERVLVTHAHPDHYGLVHFVREVSGAEVFFPAPEIARITTRGNLLETGRLLAEAGMPAETLLEVERARKRGPRPERLDDAVMPIHEGDSFRSELRGDGTFVLEALHLPGHTGGHFVFVERDRGVAFVGDQLLPEITPNPLLEPSLEEPGERRRSLQQYLDSLRTLGTLDLSLVFPGHGEPVTDPRGLIDRTLEHHERRKGVVAAHLDVAGKTPYTISRELYPRVTGYDEFLALSEVVAHLDLVVEDGDATVDPRDGMTFYSTRRD